MRAASAASSKSGGECLSGLLMSGTACAAGGTLMMSEDRSISQSTAAFINTVYVFQEIARAAPLAFRYPEAYAVLPLRSEPMVENESAASRAKAAHRASEGVRRGTTIALTELCTGLAGGTAAVAAALRTVTSTAPVDVTSALRGGAVAIAIGRAMISVAAAAIAIERQLSTMRLSVVAGLSGESREWGIVGRHLWALEGSLTDEIPKEGLPAPTAARNVAAVAAGGAIIPRSVLEQASEGLRRAADFVRVAGEVVELTKGGRCSEGGRGRETSRFGVGHPIGRRTVGAVIFDGATQGMAIDPVSAEAELEWLAESGDELVMLME